MRDAKWLADAEQAGVCPVHQHTLEARRVRITYGLVAGMPEDLRDVQRARFPFAQREVLGGCLIIIDVQDPERSSPEFADILVCGACNEAKARWVHRNPAHPWAKMWQQEKGSR
jgi:hypothetical protein